MALNFPNSPTNGQLYTDSASGNRWVWDSGNTCWVSTSTFTQTITVASSAPGSPVTGQLWWSQDYGRLLVYYSDGTSSQWVDASPSDYTSQLAYGVANAAFAKANNALANTSGASFAGDLYIPGNMGVGTSSPLIKLDVNGGMRVQSISNPASGLGMELSYDSTQGVIQAFTNRATLATAPIYFTGGQIKFPPTQNASSDANTLDDYEEGTWSPTITQSVSNPTGITYARQQGIYIKVGTLVFLSFNLYITAITNGSGNIRISNFPFTAGNVSEGDRAGMTINYCSGFTSTSCPTGGIVINNSTSIDLTTSNSADARDGRSTYCTNTGSSINLYGTIMYRASA